jgi:hypothetical protein
MATEVVAQSKYPKLALPFNIAFSVFTGLTLEKHLEKTLLKTAKQVQTAAWFKALSPEKQQEVAEEVALQGLNNSRISQKDLVGLAKDSLKEGLVVDKAGNYNIGEHSKLPISMRQYGPEILNLAQELLGSTPTIRKWLRQHLASGAFFPGKPGKKAKIELRANLFTDPDQANKVLAHEIGHLVSWLPDEVSTRGNILGHLASLHKYMNKYLAGFPGGPPPLTDIDTRRLLEEAKNLIPETAEKWVDREIRERLDITPEQVLSIWNSVLETTTNKELLDYVKTLSSAEMKSIVKEAFKGKVSPELQHLAAEGKIVGTERVRVDEPRPRAEYNAEVRAKHQEMVEEEIRKRMLLDNSQLRIELKKFTHKWKPFDATQNSNYTQYRYKSSELYADAFSAFVTSPDYLKANAPEFYRGFMGYLDANPNFKRAWTGIQNKISGGEIHKTRTEKIYKHYAKHENALLEQARRRELARKFDLGIGVIDDQAAFLRLINKYGDLGAEPAENPRWLVEESRYIGSVVEDHVSDMANLVLKPLRKLGVSNNFFGEYLQHVRVANDRADMANPDNWSKPLALERLEEMVVGLGREKFEKLEQIRKSFWGLRKGILQQAVDLDIFSDELNKKLLDTEYYAKFSVTDYFDRKFGSESGQIIHGQQGTLKGIGNPLVTTALTDIQLLYLINKQKTAKGVVKYLKKLGEDHIEDSGYAMRLGNDKTKYKVPVKPAHENLGLITVLENGKPKGYYVDKFIADIFNKNPLEADPLVRLGAKLTKPFRYAYTTWNYGFWFTNIARDFMRAATNLPKNGMAKFLPKYIKSIPDAWRSEFGVAPEVVKEMNQGKMLVSIGKGMQALGGEGSEELERILKRWHQWPKEWDKQVNTPIGKFFNYITHLPKLFGSAYVRLGNVSERTTKIASYKHMKKAFPDMSQQEIGHMVRLHGGSPDFLRRGSSYGIYNNLFIFSNAMKEGYRADFEAFRKNRGEFVKKKMLYSILPKTLTWLAAKGYLDRDEQGRSKYKVMLQNVSDWTLKNYNVIPLWMTENNKTVFLQLPMDEFSRMLGGITWSMLDHETTKSRPEQAGQIFDYLGGQIPSMTPLIDITSGMYQYAIGNNPYDKFKGRPALPQRFGELSPDDPRKLKEFGKWLSKKSGGNIIYKFPYEDLESNKTFLEKLLGYPILSNSLGRFLKVSDAGYAEDLRKIGYEERRMRASDALAFDSAIKKIHKGKFDTLTPAEELVIGLRFKEIPKRYKTLLMKNENILRAFNAAGSGEEKLRLLELDLERQYHLQRVREEKENDME